MTRFQAHLYIHGCSLTHGITAAATAQSPEGGFGILTLETCASVAILSKLCGARWDETFVRTFVEQQFAEHAGKEILRQTAGKIPGAGNMLNGTISLSVTEAILWKTYYMCSDGQAN